MVIPQYPREQIVSRFQGLAKLGDQIIVEPSTYTVGLIAESYHNNLSLVDDVPAIVDLYKHWEHVDYTDQDYILVYPVHGSEQPVGLGFSHSNDTDRLSVYFASRGTDIHFTKLVERVRAILLAHRRAYYRDQHGNSIGGATWVKWGIAKSPEDRIRRGHTVRTYDIEIRRRWRKIVTS